MEIKAEGQDYVLSLTQNPDYRLEWQVNGPIEFRLQKDQIYLRRRNGKEFRSTLLKGLPPGSDTKQPPASDSGAGTAAHREVSSATLAPLNHVSNASPISLEIVPSLPRCVALREGNPQLAPLEQTCDFALRSSANLPNFICEETASILRAMRNN